MIPRQPLRPLPRKHQLHRPSLVGVRVIVQRAVHMRRAPHPRKLPSKIRPPQPARIRPFPERRRLPIVIPAKHQRIIFHRIPLRHVKPSAFFVCVPPDIKHLISCPPRVRLKLVISVPAINKHFRVVLIEDQRIFFDQLGLHQGLLNPKRNVQILVVPHRRRPRSIKRRITRRHIHKPPRLFHLLPVRLIQHSIHLDRPRRSPRRVVRHILLRTSIPRRRQLPLRPRRHRHRLPRAPRHHHQHQRHHTTRHRHRLHRNSPPRIGLQRVGHDIASHLPPLRFFFLHVIPSASRGSPPEAGDRRFRLRPEEICFFCLCSAGLQPGSFGCGLYLQPAENSSAPSHQKQQDSSTVSCCPPDAISQKTAADLSISLTYTLISGAATDIEAQPHPQTENPLQARSHNGRQTILQTHLLRI